MKTFFQIFFAWIGMTFIINILHNYVYVNIFDSTYAHYLTIGECYVLSFVTVFYFIIMKDLFFGKDMESKK